MHYWYISSLKARELNSGSIADLEKEIPSHEHYSRVSSDSSPKIHTHPELQDTAFSGRKVSVNVIA